MKQQVIYVFTHDSIGLGEDGPTHQPVEQLAGLRSIPNLLVFRPCDAIETHECWELAIMHKNSPSAIALSRQSLPLLRNNFVINKSSRGGYLIEENNKSFYFEFINEKVLHIKYKDNMNIDNLIRFYKK